MKLVKIRVKSPEHSKKIQDHLFSLGYEWASGQQITLYETYPFLYTRLGRLISCGECSKYFNEDDNQEVELIEKISYEFKEISKGKVVKVGEFSYYEDELAEALKNIKPIN